MPAAQGEDQMSRFRSINFLACSAMAVAVPTASEAQPLPISIKASALGAALTGAPAAVAMAMLAPEISGVYAASRTLKPFTTPPADQ